MDVVIRELPGYSNKPVFFLTFGIRIDFIFRDDRHKTAGTGKTISRKKTAEQEKKKN